MTAIPPESDLIDVIQGRLERCGWRAASGEGWRWVDHTFQNQDATVRVRYLPRVDVIRFDFESDQCFASLAISFGDSLHGILDLITHHQSSLSVETWRAFIVPLTELSPRIRSLADTDGEDTDGEDTDGENAGGENAGGEHTDGEDDAVSNPDQGMAALREIDWE